MTSYEGIKGDVPAYGAGAFSGFHHVEFWVGNAKQAAGWFVARFGFTPIAYRGLETGSRTVCTHVLGMNGVRFALSSQLNPGTTVVAGDDMSAHLVTHGDGVKDIAFAVADCRKVFDAAVARGAAVVAEPHTLSDEHGSVTLATIRTYGDTVHTFVQRGEYAGAFLPGFRAVTSTDPLVHITPSVGLERIDHIVGNMPDKGMLPTVEWYERVLQFHRFWSVDDSQIHTEYSALRSIVMADYDEIVKMPINEPAKGLRKSQIQEYVEYYGGSGAQHIALLTTDIINAVTQLRARGMEFLKVPDTYYDGLAARLHAAGGIKVKEDLAVIKSLNILVDMDEKGYLLQIFTAPLQDRPTVFLEIIQREGCNGFGAGNFKSLFESIERAQAERGNLTAEEPAPAAGAASGGAGAAAAGSK